MCLQGVLGRKLGSNIGIVAGSPFAVQELTVIMCKVIEHWRRVIPSGCISVHVDDIAISVWGRKVEEVQDRVLQAVKALDEVVEDTLGMKFSKEKTYIVQSQTGVVDGLVKAKMLEGDLCQAGEYIRRLGVDHNLEGEVKKEGLVAVGRRLKGMGRGIRLRRIARGKRKGINLYRAGVMGAAMYGGELSMWSKVEIEKERKRAAGHSGLRGMGVHSSLALFAEQPSCDPGYRAAKDPICRIAKEVWLRQIRNKRNKEEVDQEDWEGIQGLNRSQGDLLTAAEIWSLLQTTKEIGRKDKEKAPRTGHRHGPSSVLAGALDLVGWEIVEPCIWKNRGGDEMNISKVSPAMLVSSYIGIGRQSSGKRQRTIWLGEREPTGRWWKSSCKYGERPRF